MAVIPAEINQEQSAALESLLKSHNIRIFRDVHVSGHASREDLRDFINILNPENVIPSHGVGEMVDAMEELCKLIGMKPENIHCIETGESLEWK